MARILIIEDDDAIRVVLRMALTRFGHTVTEAANGREGLVRFQHDRPELVITDIVMPEKEGLEVLIELRKEQTPVKIIVISGGGQQAAMTYLRMAKLLGAARVLEKPFTIDALIPLVDEVLRSDAAPPASAKL